MSKHMLHATTFLIGLAWFSTVAAGGVDTELRQAAKLHRGGDSAGAMTIWQHWADRGDADAAYNLAVVHHYGDGVPADLGKALRWYRVAADRNDKAAQVQIGLMYLNGEGVRRDEQEAHRWFTLNRAHHAHHDQSPQMKAWRAQAVALIEERDLREAVLASRTDSAKVMADLRRRAGFDPATTLAAN
jgi:TPR repeat protein